MFLTGKAPHRLEFLNTWSPAGGAVRRGFAGGSGSLGQALSLDLYASFLFPLSLHPAVVEDEDSELPAPGATSVACCHVSLP